MLLKNFSLREWEVIVRLPRLRNELLLLFQFVLHLLLIVEAHKVGLESLRARYLVLVASSNLSRDAIEEFIVSLELFVTCLHNFFFLTTHLVEVRGQHIMI